MDSPVVMAAKGRSVALVRVKCYFIFNARLTETDYFHRTPVVVLSNNPEPLRPDDEYSRIWRRYVSK